MTFHSYFEIKEIDASVLTGAYQAFGVPLSNLCYGAVIINESDTPVYISIDGVTDNFRVGAGYILPLSALPRQKTLTKGEYLLNKGTQLYIRHNIPPGNGAIVFNAFMTM